MRLTLNKGKLPFEEKASKVTGEQHVESSFRLLRSWNLSLRGTVLLVSLICSFLFLFYVDGGFRISLIFIPLILLVWRFSFALFEHPGLMPLNLFLNTLIICPFFMLPKFALDEREMIAFVPLVLGITAVSSINDDGRAYFYTAKLDTEILLPMVVSFIVSAVSFVFSLFLFEKVMFGTMLLIASLLLSMTSLIYSNLYKKPVIFSTDKILFEAGDYYLRRMYVVLTNILVFALIFGYKLLISKLTIDLPCIVIPAAIALFVMIIMFSCPITRDGSYLVEIAISFVAMLYLRNWCGLVLSIVIDFVFTSVVLSYRGHKIFSSKPKCFEGIPALMVIFSILIIVTEQLIAGFMAK